jgi:exosortase
MSVALSRAPVALQPSSRENRLLGAIPGSALLLLLGLLAWPTLISLSLTWESNPDYAHGWLLVPVLVWTARKSGFWKAEHSSERGLGLFTFGAGVTLHLAVQIMLWPLFDYLAWHLLLRGILLFHWGRPAVRRAFPVLLGAFFLFPLPAAWLNELALVLQELVSRSAAAALNVFWVCYQRGSLLHVSGLDAPLSVAVECSGLRQLVIFITAGGLLALYLPGALWRRLLLLLATVPIAIFANVCRVVLLVTVAHFGGMRWIDGAFHGLPLLVTLPLGAGLLWWCFVRLSQHERVHRQETTDSVSPLHGAVRPGSWGLLLVAAGLAVFLQILLQKQLNSAEESIPVVQPAFLEQLPLNLGEWRGQGHPEAQQVADQSSYADASLTRAYVDARGNAAALYVVFSRTGRDRDHHPEICLRDAAGAVEIPAQRGEVALSQPMHTAIRMRYQRDQLRQTTIYYWHYTVMPEFSEQQNAFQRLHLLQQCSLPSVTVQVQTNQSHPQALEAMERTFLPLLDDWMKRHLPEGTRVGYERRSIRLVWARGNPLN